VDADRDFVTHAINDAGRAGTLRRHLGVGLALSVAATGLLLIAPISADAAATSPPDATTTPRPTASTSPLHPTSAAHCSSTPFRASPANHRWFRIPAIVQTNAGTLVAFAERRDTMHSDYGNFDVVRARSTDHGCHWSAYTVVGNDGANRVSNPVPIVDSTTGKILLFSAISQRPASGGHGKGVYLQTSSDDGKTFTPLLSGSLKPLGHYKGGLTGPGHGIQLTVTHPGRLIFAMGYKAASGFGAYGIYSDDHGVTWHTGFDQQDTTGKVPFQEGTIAELPSGDLFISYRELHDGAAAGTARQYAISADGGASLRAPFKESALKIVSVEGSALALTGAHGNELLFSAPGDTTAYLRRDMTIFVSTTGGVTWARKYQVELESTPAAYSDLVQLDANSIGVLYETGQATWKERIAYESIGISALTHPTLVASHLSYQRSSNPTRTSGNAKVLVKVTATGITSPPGRITLTSVGNGVTRRASVDLVHSNHGVRATTLPRLKKGSYRLTLTYSGTGRIKRITKSAGTLHVISG
jgi:sialidase-1